MTTVKKGRSRAIFFPAARIKIDDKELHAGKQVYSLNDVWEAQVWNDGQPAHFGLWLWPIPVEMLAIGLGLFFRLFFIWIAIYSSVFLVDTVRRVRKEIERAADHALVIDTGQKWVQIYASYNYLYLKVIEKAINRAVRNYILAKVQQQTAGPERFKP